MNKWIYTFFVLLSTLKDKQQFRLEHNHIVLPAYKLIQFNSGYGKCLWSPIKLSFVGEEKKACYTAKLIHSICLDLNDKTYVVLRILTSHGARFVNIITT